MKPQGWCSPEKAAALADAIRAAHVQLAVEIGVFGGASLIPQALALRDTDGLIYGIDPWTRQSATEGELDPTDRAWWEREDLGKIYVGCMEAIGEEGLWPWVRILACPSEVAVEAFRDETVDLLSVDGNNSEIVSFRDVRLYLPKVKRGSLIFFDDLDWKTTALAVSYLDRRCERVRDVGNCRIYRKT